MIERVTIIGAGLIGTSVGLALRQSGFRGTVIGWDRQEDQAKIALDRGAFTRITSDPEKEARESDLIVLATPVLAILDWMERLAPSATAGQLITDVGSTKLEIARAASRVYPQSAPGSVIGAPQQKARFLPGHPMAGKESGGAALGDPELFRNAAWLFTPVCQDAHPLEAEWRGWVERFGARILDLPAERHDQICAWVSHLPQMLSTALAALLEDTFADDPEARDQIAAIGGRALRETTRLGSSPYSMWRDVALTNTDPIADTLLALEQRLAHLRENLRTPELREEFRLANEFRKRG